VRRRGGGGGRRRRREDPEIGRTRLERGGKKGEEWKMMFWNVAGVRNKDKDFWESLKKWEVMVLSETWLEKKEWERVKGRLPKGYKWGVQGATRDGKRGRAKGGMIMGIREELVEGEIKIEGGIEGIMTSDINVGKERWRIIGVYVNEGVERMMRKLEKWTDKGEEERKLIIGGDFNARVGEKGGFEGEEGGIRERKVKDGVLNAEGRRLVNWIEENGWSIFNGCTEGDEEGEYTFTGGKGNSTIDYVIGDEEVRGRIERVVIGDKIDSDHHPVEVWMKGRGIRRERNSRKRNVWRGIWDEEGREQFKRRMGSIEMSEGSVKEQWRSVRGRVIKSLKEIEEERRSEMGWRERKGWWDEECRERKREVRRKLRKWRRREGEEREYRSGKKEFKTLCEKKKREERER